MDHLQQNPRSFDIYPQSRRCGALSRSISAIGSVESCNFETDSNILMCNRIFWKRREKEAAPKEFDGSSNHNEASGSSKGSAALKVWCLAKKIGVKGKENGSKYVSELQMMEDRDH